MEACRIAAARTRGRENGLAAPDAGDAAPLVAATPFDAFRATTLASCACANDLAVELMRQLERLIARLAK
jgi:hypothetical protein